MCKHCIAGGSNKVWDRETIISQLVKQLPCSWWSAGNCRILKIAVYFLVLNILEARGEATEEIIIYLILSLYLCTTHFACQLFIKKLFLNFLFQHEKIVANGITHAIDYRTTNYAQEVKK